MSKGGQNIRSRLTANPLDVPRYRVLADALARGMSMNKACKLAGVSPNTAVKLTQDADVIQYVSKIRAEFEQELKVSRQDVLKGFLHAIQQADTQALPVPQIMGWKEIAQMEGMYAPQKVEHDHKGQVEHIHKELESYSTEELENMLSKEGAIDGEFTEIDSDEEDRPAAGGN